MICVELCALFELILVALSRLPCVTLWRKRELKYKLLVSCGRLKAYIGALIGANEQQTVSDQINTCKACGKINETKKCKEFDFRNTLTWSAYDKCKLNPIIGM